MKTILVVGPSGAGKDTLLRAAKIHYSKSSHLRFVQRCITRPPDDHEDNFYLDEQAFSLLIQASYFISTWRAHGNHYGIPRYQMQPENGTKVMIASISRSAVTDFEKMGLEPLTLIVTASRQTLKERLLARGREDGESVRKRLVRAEKPVVASKSILFDNSAPLEESTVKFLRLLENISNAE